MTDEIPLDDGETEVEPTVERTMPRSQSNVAFLDEHDTKPDTILYRKPQNRPTIDDIRQQRQPSTQADRQPSVHYEREAEREQFQWFIGVFVPMFLNLVCVTFFVDLHRSIQTIGWGLASLFLFASHAMSYVTLISLCVISTNGDMRDGGLYYLLSRTLGPEIGGATGLILVIAHTTAISFRLSYAASLIINFYEPKFLTKSARWDRTLWQVIFNLILFIVSMFGIKTIFYLMVALFVLLVGGVLVFYVGFFSRKPHTIDFFTGPSITTLRNNFGLQHVGEHGILAIFGILFPASNAIMTCANFSGNLNPPRRAIPLGGFIAMLISSVLLIFVFLLEACSLDYKAEHDKFSALRISAVPIISYIGFIAACFGGSMTMHTGGSRIISAMCQDSLLPKFFSKWRVKGEIMWGHIFQLIISLLFSVVDSSDMMTYITNIFFLLPFSLVNYTVWTAATAHYPGFRPSFKFYSKWLSLICAILCIVRMFVIKWIVAIPCVGLSIIFYLIFKCRKIEDHWGTVTQSKTFYQTLKEELNLYHVQPHPKTFRPNIMLITTLHPDQRHPTIDFLNMLLHNNGMAAVGRVHIVDEASNFDFMQLVSERESTYLTTSDGYKMFYDVTTAKTFVEGVTDLILMMGIGRMRPNTLCLVFPEDWKEASYVDIPAGEYIKSLDIAEEAVLNAFVVRHVKLLSEIHPGFIDVWWNINGSGFTLILAFLLSKSPRWKKNTSLRIITIADIDAGAEADEEEHKLADIMYAFRISADIMTLQTSVSMDEPTPMTVQRWQEICRAVGEDSNYEDNLEIKRSLLTADLVRAYSSDAAAIFMLIPNRPPGVSKNLYMAQLDLMTEVNRPFCIVKQNGERPFGFSV